MTYKKYKQKIKKLLDKRIQEKVITGYCLELLRSGMIELIDNGYTNTYQVTKQDNYEENFKMLEHYMRLDNI